MISGQMNGSGVVRENGKEQSVHELREQVQRQAAEIERLQKKLNSALSLVAVLRE